MSRRRGYTALVVAALASVGAGLVPGVLERFALNDVRTVLRLVVGLGVVAAVLGVLTAQWLGVLVSLGVIGFAVTFALQQPLFSPVGRFYILVNQPSGRTITVPNSVVLSSHVARGDVEYVRNELYDRILDRLDEHPDRVAFPVGRNR